MGRSGLVAGVPLILAVASAFSGCGSSGAKATSYPVPANILLTPASTASMDVGATLVFTAQPQDFQKTSVTEPVSFFSSNPAVVTVAATGVACAGTWDSISNPQVCTPGSVGIAQITGSAQGVSSPPTTVYVHQHIDSITVGPLPTQSNPSVPCVTKGNTFEYAAHAFSHGTDITSIDITSTVGQFNWQTANISVVNLTAEINGSLFQSQVEAKAGLPGISSTFASVGGVNSVPFDFITCPVQSITLSVNGSSSNSLTLAQGASETITAAVTDSLNNVITGIPLTWTSSDPTSVAVSGSGASATMTGAVSTTTPGGASVIASCTPPTCNLGFQPSLPIYPQSAIGITVTPTTGATPASGTLYVTTQDCHDTSGCVTTAVPVTLPGNTLGAAIILPASPDSLVFDRAGNTAFFGTDLGELGTKGLMEFTASATTPAVNQNTLAVGKVISISPDGSKIILSDLADPNSAPQVFVFDTTGGGTTVISTPGATAVAADFSPDSLKAFIVASSGSSSTLYVYSKLDALQTIPLGAQASDVAFLPSGNFGYIANAPASELSIVPTCDNPPAATPPVITTTPTTGPPHLIRPIADGRMLTLEPPGIELFTPTIVPPALGAPVSTGCAFSRPYPGATSGSPLIPGDLTVSNTATFFNLGEGNFIPRQLIVSQDGSTAYIIANDSNNNPLGTVLVFNLINHTTSAIALAGNAIPLQAALTPDGTVLYVGGSDGEVHAVSTVAGGEFQQITFPLGLCQNVAGQPFTPACNPDLLAIRP